MWTKLLDAHLTRFVRQGSLTIAYPDGVTRRYGDGRGDPVRLTILDPAMPRKFILAPDLAAGEAYMDGRMTIENDDLHGLLGLALKNRSRIGALEVSRALWLVRKTLGRLRQFNPAPRSQRNVAHHYDLSEALYDIFLDDDRQYSCAYFRTGTETLDEAQAAKKAHIAGKLLLKPGMRVLDIGCGWGGMALTLARDYGVQVVGVTLSREQLKLARARISAAGLQDRIEIRLQDYRAVDETFDRIVSVGMFEHVGTPHYRTYFRKLRQMLTTDGVALVHTIGSAEPPAATSEWVEKYIFPGGYVPAMSEVMRAVEKETLFATDVEVWRLHYAQTLRHWHDRFMEGIAAARDLYDERFCRMWRYYLVASELAFRHANQCVFQFQLARTQDAVPLTRDYLYRATAGPSGADSAGNIPAEPPGRSVAATAAQ